MILNNVITQSTKVTGVLTPFYSSIDYVIK